MSLIMSQYFQAPNPVPYLRLTCPAPAAHLACRAIDTSAGPASGGDHGERSPKKTKRGGKKPKCACRSSGGSAQEGDSGASDASDVAEDGPDSLQGTGLGDISTAVSTLLA